MGILRMIWAFLRAFFASRAKLAAETVMLRQQLIVAHRSAPHPKLRRTDRIVLCWLSRLWFEWRSTLLILRPATVIRWHRQGFKLYWRRKSRKKPGRPKIDAELRNLIRRMCRENPTWGAPRIQSELALLGHNVAESTVDKYMIHQPKPPSQTWRTFLKNHVGQMVSIDFFTVPTAFFTTLYGFIILSHERRRIVHCGVTRNPTAEWVANQVIGAFPYDTVPRFMIRDRDSIYDERFKRRLRNMGIEEVVTAPRSPWQNPYVERMIGSIRRECLDHVIVLGERHLHGLLRSWVNYYHEDRTHLSLEKDAPEGRPAKPRPSATAKVVALPRVGGLHHRYEWRQAA